MKLHLLEVLYKYLDIFILEIFILEILILEINMYLFQCNNM